MKKKVIFIGSPAFSGSTMLDMMLANDPKGKSVGEIIRLMLPHRKHYLQERRELSKSSKAWRKIISEGPAHLYQNLFNTHPDISFFIDSSKDVFWIQKQTELLQQLGYEVKHVLLYKEPTDIAQSFIKRNKGKEWEKSWENYYRLYFSLINNPTVVSYKNLTSNPQQTLRLMCEKLDIPFFEEKHHFWEKDHDTLFGNDRTRFHLQNAKLSDRSKVAVTQENKYQTIYYLPCKDQSIIDAVNKSMDKNPKLAKIWTLLRSKEIGSLETENDHTNSITMNTVEIGLRKFRRIKMRLLFKLKAPFI